MRGWRSVATLATGNLQTTLLTDIYGLETPLRRCFDSSNGPPKTDTLESSLLTSHSAESDVPTKTRYAGPDLG